MQWPKGWIKASRLSIFFLKTRQIILLWKRPFIPEILKQSKDKYIDKDEDKDKEEERLEFYSRLANCWWVGGGQKSDLRRPVDPALHYWLHHPTHTLQHRAQNKLHSKQSNTQPTHRTQDRAHSSTLFYCCRREARPKGPEPALHYFYPDPLYPALGSYLELWKHSCKLFLVKKKGEKRQNKSFGVMKFRSRQQQQQQPLWVCARSTGSTPLHSTDW